VLNYWFLHCLWRCSFLVTPCSWTPWLHACNGFVSLTWTPWLYGCNDGSVRFVRMPWLCGYNDGFACLRTPWLLGDNRLVSLVWTPRLCGCDGRLMSCIFFFVMVIFPIIVSTLSIGFQQSWYNNLFFFFWYTIIAFNFYFIKIGSWITTIWGSDRLVSFNQLTG
jgi:hypothetical protein